MLVVPNVKEHKSKVALEANVLVVEMLGCGPKVLDPQLQDLCFELVQSVGTLIGDLDMLINELENLSQEYDKVISLFRS